MTLRILFSLLAAVPLASHAAQPRGTPRASSCPAAPSAERLSVTRFLQDPNEVDWRSAHDVRAASVDELRPLSGGRDVALCARLDSMIVRGPAYYFHAGRYIIATTTAAVRDTVGISLYPTRAPRILVFDAAGNFVYLPGGSYGINGDDPFSLAVLSASDGRVALRWSLRGATSEVRTRLQRAMDNAAFVDLGGILTARDSILADSAVSTGHRYHYRMLIIDPDGRHGIHSQARSVILADPGTLTRRATGLLYRTRFDSSRASLAPQWSAESGTWSIRQGMLEAEVDGERPALIRLDAVPPRKDMRVQIVVSRTRPTDRVTLVARRSATISYRLSAGAAEDRVALGEARLTRVAAESVFNLTRASDTALASTRFGLIYSVDAGRHGASTNGHYLLEAGDATTVNFPPGQVAIEVSGGRRGDVVRFEDVVVTAGRYIKVRGLPARYGIRIDDAGAPAADPRQARGDVTLDVWDRAMPLKQIAIINPQGTTLRTYRPEGGIWSGDEFEFSPSPEFLAAREVDSLTNYVGEPRVAQHVGLPTLEAIALPNGSREYRIALHCGACLPEYVVRLRESKGRPITGEAYMAWFDPDDARPGDNSSSAHNIRTPPAACVGPLRPVLRVNWWCPVTLQNGATWDQVLHRLTELGVLGLGSPNGYAPGPPGSEKGSWEGHHGCQDVGGEALDMASLDGRDYRRAEFWCLDKHGPAGSEHARVSAAYDYLQSVLPH